MIVPQSFSKIRNNLAFVFILSVFLSSCASPPPINNIKIDSEQHQLSLQTLHKWQIKGKFGFKDPQQAKSASLSWQQINDEYVFSLNSILGTSILSLQGSPVLTTLKTDGEVFESDNASELIWQMTGWALPVEHLPIWIKGQSLAQDNVTLSEQGWVSQLQPNCKTCQGWELNYDNYQNIQAHWLPHKIIMRNKNKHIQITIKVNTWSIN